MAEQTGKFLTELPELTTPIEDDLMYIVDDETSKRITLKNLKSVVGGEDVTGTASGAIATFIDGGDDKPMESLVAEIEATQSGSGTPSPSNVRPIVGRSEVNITVSDGETDNVTTIPLGRTVYGGTLDVTRGILTVTHGEVELGSLSWTRTTSYTNPLFYAIVFDKMESSIDAECEWYENGGLITGTTALNNMQNETFGCGNNSRYIYVRDDQYTSVSDFTTATANVKFKYEFATPQTYTLTPEEVSTILGYNNISADSGDVSVVYVRDLNITINDLINRVTALENE